jgi:hypothetical protein
MANAYLDFIESRIGFRPKVSPNKRDAAWNIMLTRTNAVKLVSLIYGETSFCLTRKKSKANEILSLCMDRDGVPHPKPLLPQTVSIDD